MVDILKQIQSPSPRDMDLLFHGRKRSSSDGSGSSDGSSNDGSAFCCTSDQTSTDVSRQRPGSTSSVELDQLTISDLSTPLFHDSSPEVQLDQSTDVSFLLQHKNTSTLPGASPVIQLDPSEDIFSLLSPEEFFCQSLDSLDNRVSTEASGQNRPTLPGPSPVIQLDLPEDVILPLSPEEVFCQSPDRLDGHSPTEASGQDTSTFPGPSPGIQLDQPEDVFLPLASDLSPEVFPDQSDEGLFPLLTDELLNDSPDVLDDATFTKATVETISTNRLTPLLKQELKLLIQCRRHSEGQDLRPKDFDVVKTHEPYQPTEVDLRRRARRKDLNKESAQRCRDKKNEQAELLQKEADELTDANIKLKREVISLRKELRSLQGILDSCGCTKNRP